MVVSLAGMTEPTPGGDPHVRALSASLLLRVEELGAELADRIRSVDPVYREGRIVTVDDLQETCRANLTLVFARLAGSSEINIQAPALTGRRRAEQGMPLPTTLRAYRLGRCAATHGCATAAALSPVQLPDAWPPPPAPRSSVGGIQSP